MAQLQNVTFFIHLLASGESFLLTVVAKIFMKFVMPVFMLGLNKEQNATKCMETDLANKS